MDLSADKPAVTPERVAAAAAFQCDEFTIDGELAAGSLVVLNFHGRIVGASAALLVDRICRNFDEIPGNIILNLADCPFFSSVAIGLVVALAEQRRALGGKLIIANAARQIQQVIGMMGMTWAFYFCPTLEEALSIAKTTEKSE